MSELKLKPHERFEGWFAGAIPEGKNKTLVEPGEHSDKQNLQNNWDFVGFIKTCQHKFVIYSINVTSMEKPLGIKLQCPYLNLYQHADAHWGSGVPAVEVCVDNAKSCDWWKG